MAGVSLVRCSEYDSVEVEESIRRSVELLGGIEGFVSPGSRVLLKANLLSARKPKKRVTTDPSVVRAVARIVLDAGALPVIGDSPGIESFRRVSVATGMADIAEELGIECAELTVPRPVASPDGTLFRQLEISSGALDADVIINLPKLKAHCQMVLTMGVKNLFGTIVAQRKAEWHHMAGVDRDTFASLLLDIYLSLKPSLTILDGVWAMEGTGPSNGVPRKTGLIAASSDALSLDIAMCRLLGVPLNSFPLYRAAKKRGLLDEDRESAALLGDPPTDFDLKGFSVPELDSLNLLPGGFEWFTRRFLVSKPVQDSKSCIRCGQCVELCPANAMEMESRRVSIDYGKCIRCYCCQEICPADAIKFKKGLLLRFLNCINR